MMDLTALEGASRLGLALGVIGAPLVQTDAAVVGTAAAAAARLADPLTLFALLMTGILISDMGKYFIGRFAHASPWAARLAQGAAVRKAQDSLRGRLGMAMLAARFVPGARIPLFVGAGLARAPVLPVFGWVLATGLLYAGAVFAAFLLIGVAAGEELARVLPWIAGGLALLAVAVWLARRFLRRAG